MKIENLESFEIETVRLQLDTLFPDSDLYIELREMSSLEIVNMPKGSEKELVEYLFDLLPKAMVNHNFEDADGNKYPVKEVAKAIKRKQKAIKLLIDWQKKIVSPMMNVIASDKSPSSSSEEEAPEARLS